MGTGKDPCHPSTLARWREEPRAAALIKHLTQERAAGRHPKKPKMFVTTPGLADIRAALEHHGARIMGAAGLTPEAEVTEIKTRRQA